MTGLVGTGSAVWGSGSSVEGVEGVEGPWCSAGQATPGNGGTSLYGGGTGTSAWASIIAIPGSPPSKYTAVNKMR